MVPPVAAMNATGSGTGQNTVGGTASRLSHNARTRLILRRLLADNARQRARQRGALSVFTAIAIVVLIGFVGLAVDTGRMLTAHAELQSAVDACALSAALELNGRADAPARAVNAGRFVGNRNRVDFQSGPVAISTTGVTFAQALAGPYLTANAIAGSSATYVQCRADVAGIATFFMKVLGVSSVDLAATAKASVAPSQSVCAMPMALFEGSSTGSDPNNFDYRLGDVIPITGQNTGRGFFTWADVLNSTSDNTLTPYKNALVKYGTCGALTAPGRCLGTKTGEVASLVEEWNTRFGLYKSYTPQTAVPDLTGYGYNPATLNDPSVLADYADIRAPARSAYQGSIPSYTIPMNVNRDYGAPYRRLAVMPVVRDDAACGSSAKKLVGWACVLLLKPVSTANDDPAKIMFISRADSPSSPCRASGTAGGAGAIGPLVPVIVQ